MFPSMHCKCPGVYHEKNCPSADDLPVHVLIGVNKDGDGPVDENNPDYDRTVCWCGDPECQKPFETGYVDG